MKTVLASGGRIVVQERDCPEPGPGQVLLRSRVCGICGSDLHMLHHGEAMRAIAPRLGLPALPEDAAIPLGHEFVAEIAAFGPGTEQTLGVGQRVCCLPFLLNDEGQQLIGADPSIAGGFSEYFLATEALLIPIPDHVSDDAAALIEPLAVAIHAVARAKVDDHAALVVGCGPIGLATITALKIRGVDDIVAVDPVPGRRALAGRMGAREVLDPAAGTEMQRLEELAGDRPCVVYECVGRPAVVPSLIERAPRNACVVFVGVHTEEVSILPMVAMVKELDLHFAFYYTAEDFAAAARAVSEGKMDESLWITAKVGLDRVAEVFGELSAPNTHIKVLVTQ